LSQTSGEAEQAGRQAAAGGAGPVVLKTAFVSIVPAPLVSGEQRSLRRARS